MTMLAVVLLAGCGSPAERAAKYLERAQAYFDQEDYVKARIEAQNAAQVEPKNAAARYLLALIAEKDGDFRQMFGHLLVAVDADPGNVDARLKLGTLYFLGQAWDKAAAEVDALVELAGSDPRVRLLRARVLIQQGENEAGLAEIRAAIDSDPDNIDAILLSAAAAAVEDLDKGLGVLDAAIARLDADKSRALRELRVLMLSQGKRLTEAEQGLQALSEDFPEQSAYQFQLARFYSSQGRVDEADALLRKVAEAQPEDVENRLNYVQFLAARRDPERAIAALQTFVEETPDQLSLRLALGEIQEATQRFDEARQTYQALAGRDAKSVEGLKARNRLAALALRDKDLDGALALVEDILKDAPDDAAALLLRAGARFATERFAEAIADLRLVLRKEPENTRALLLLAQSYLRTNDAVLAKDSYRRLLEVEPNSVDGNLQLAAMYSAEKNHAESERLLRALVEARPDHLLAGGRLVEVLMVQQKTAEAEKEARRLAALENQSGVGDFSLGRTLVAKRDFAAAAEAFRRAAAARPDDPMPLESLAQSLVAAGKPREAIAVLDQALGSEANDLLARFLLGNIYGREGDTDRSRQYFEEVIAKKPDAVLAYVSLAGSYPKSADSRIAVYRRGLEAVPADVQLSMLLGSELEQLQRHDEALEVYGLLVEKQPDFVPGLNNLAALLLDFRTDDAKSLTRALEIAKRLASVDNPAVLDTVGWAWYRNGDAAQAVGILERVVAKDNTAPVFRYHLGMAYLATGNTVGARQELTAALAGNDAFTGRADAEAALARL